MNTPVLSSIARFQPGELVNWPGVVYKVTGRYWQSPSSPKVVVYDLVEHDSPSPRVQFRIDERELLKVG